MLKLSLSKIRSFVLCLLGIITTVDAKDSYLYKNVVRITIIQSNNEKKNGFGFIVYEGNDFYYIATAEHVVQIENETTIKILFYNHLSEKIATIVNLDKKLDLALLKVEKPDNYHVWEYCGITKNPEIGDRIKIIGRYGNWSVSSDRTMGKIISVSQNQLKAEFYGAVVGSSGGPLISGNKIIGMITDDVGNQIIALPITVIENQIGEWLKFNSLPIKDFPILCYGINLGGSFEKIFHTKNTPLLKRSPAYPIFNPGIFLELTFYEHTSFRLETTYRSFNKKTNRKYGPYHQFRNHFFTYSASLHYNFLSYTQNYFRAENENPTFSKLIIGCALNKMNPEINIENNGWTALRDQYGLAHQYSDNFISFIFGIGTDMNVEFITLKMDIFFEYFATKYLYMDIVNPFDVNEKNDWVISVNLKIGLIHRPKSSKIKLIR